MVVAEVGRNPVTEVPPGRRGGGSESNDGAGNVRARDEAVWGASEHEVEMLSRRMDTKGDRIPLYAIRPPRYGEVAVLQGYSIDFDEDLPIFDGWDVDLAYGEGVVVSDLCSMGSVRLWNG